jgi:hypothetical protein
MKVAKLSSNSEVSKFAKKIGSSTNLGSKGFNKSMKDSSNRLEKFLKGKR